MKQIIPTLVVSILALAQALPAVAQSVARTPTTGAPKQPIKQDIPTWEVKEEPWGSWNELSFVDETGKNRSGWTRNLGYYKDWKGTWKKNTGSTPVFTMRQSGQRKKNLPDGGTSWISLYETQATDYVVVVSQDSDKVTKPGTTLSSSPRYQSHMTAKGSTMLVFPPGKSSQEKPKEEPKKEEPKKEQPKKEEPKKEQPKKEEPKKEEPKKEEPKKEEPKKEEPKKEEPKKEEPQAEKVPPLTPFELAVINGMGQAEVDAFTKEQEAAIKDEKQKDTLFKKWRPKVLKTVEDYIHPAWKPQNPNAPLVKDRFDHFEREYLKQRLVQISSAAVHGFNQELYKAQEALSKGGAKGAEAANAFIGKYRHILKSDMNLYVSAANTGTVVDAKKQLEYAAEAAAACANASIEDCKKIIDNIYAGKKNTPTVPPKVDEKKPGTPEAKPSDPAEKGKAKPAEPPVPGKAPLPGDDTAKPEEKKESHDFMKYAKGGGLLFAILGGVFGLLFAGPGGLLVGAAVGAGIGFAAGYLLHWLFG